MARLDAPAARCRRARLLVQTGGEA